jgi:hypothetical protein
MGLGPTLRKNVQGPDETAGGAIGCAGHRERNVAAVVDRLARVQQFIEGLGLFDSESSSKISLFVPDPLEVGTGRGERDHCP